MEETKKINLACGNQYIEGFINIDDCSMFDCKVDMKADIKTLEWNKNSLEEIRLSHFVMYLRPEELQPLLRKWCSWLKPQGILDIETSDIKKVSRIVASVSMPDIVHNHGLINLFGNEQTSPHRWGWSSQTLSLELYRSGFSSIKQSKQVKKTLRDFRLIAIK